MMNAGYHWEWLSAFISFCTTIIMPSKAVSDFRLLRLVHPSPLPIGNSTDIFFCRPISLDFNNVVGGPSSIGVISHRNLAPAGLEYALPEASKAGFST